jgi:hypothetical protein
MANSSGPWGVFCKRVDATTHRGIGVIAGVIARQYEMCATPHDPSVLFHLVMLDPFN